MDSPTVSPLARRPSLGQSLVYSQEGPRPELKRIMRGTLASRVFEELKIPLALLDAQGRISAANRAFERLFPGMARMPGGGWDVPALRTACKQLTERIVHQFTDVEVEGRVLSGQRVEADGETSVLLVVEERSCSPHNQNVSELTARLITAQDDERRRVARELHDDLSQKVAELRFGLDRLPADLDALRRQAEALGERVREIAHGLHPSAIEHLGLEVALRSSCRAFAAREGIAVRFRASGVPRHLPIEMANSLYMVAQEALRNAAKHAGTARVGVTLRVAGGELQLRVRDHGCGFQPGSAGGSGGLGLVSMQERVRLLGGEFRIESHPKPGVMIDVRVPLPGKGEA